MENVVCFELYAGKVLGLLYLAFPLPKSISAAEIVQGIDAGSRDETERRKIAAHTVLWLERAGYIERTTRDEIGDFRGSLTAKGFECLRALPTGLAKKGTEEAAATRTLGDELAEAAKEGALDTVKEVVKQTLAIGVGFALNVVKSYVGL